MYSVIKKLRPKEVKLTFSKQGSCDPESNNSRARLMWCKQLGVRMGIYDVYEVELKPQDVPQTNLPKYYDPKFVTKIHLDGFAHGIESI